MARSYEDKFIEELYNAIADYAPTLVCQHRARKYERFYYRYKNVKISITHNKLDNTVQAISITKL